MPAGSKKRSSWLTVLLVVAAVAVWAYEQKGREDKPDSPSPRGKTSAQPSPSVPTTPVGKQEKEGGYEVYRNCKLAEARNNDGDSFMVALPDGKRAEFRLYFVDTPESAFKTYRDGDNNHQRIAEQAQALGGITPEQAVKTGQAAKHLILDLLSSRPFTLFTRWDSPFQDERYHAFIQINQGGKTLWMDELLVEKGLARIHTKGADLPDGTPYPAWKRHLQDLENAAKRAKAGAWGF